MNFYTGQRVVCVSPTGMDTERRIVPEQCPIKGHTYTVRGYSESSNSALWLVELVNSPAALRPGRPIKEPTFFDGRFRLVEVEKTDISVFTSTFKKTKVEA